MKFCEVCGVEIGGGDGDNRCPDCEEHEVKSKAKRAKANRARKEREYVLGSLGLVKVRGALGGVYWE